MSTGKFNGARSTLAAGMLVLSAVFAQVAPDTAFAQGAPRQAAVQQVKEVSAHGVGAEALGMGAARASNDALAVVLHSSNQQVISAVRSGVAGAVAEGAPVKVLIVADPVAGQADSVDIYADGQNFTTFSKDTNGWIADLGSNDKAGYYIGSSLKGALAELNRDVVQVRLAEKALAKDKR